VGREPAIRRYLPTHEVAFQVLSGTRVAMNDFFRGPLIRVADELAARFAARNEEEEIAVGPLRVGIPRFSPAGFREAVHNALVHRDYTRLGAVHVQWRGEEIGIGSPGGFVDSVKLEKLLVTVPTPRNPVLADAFKRIGLVERTGRGIDTIYEGQLRYGRQAPDYSRSTDGTVQVVLPSGQANLAVTRLILEHDTPARRMSVDEMLAINAIEREGELDLDRAAELMQRSEAAAVSVLDRLVDAGVLQSRSERRARVYEFADAVLQGAFAGAGPRRVGGVDVAHREDLVLQFVGEHGRITRSQAADLCQVEGREARQVLEKLVKRGALVVKGERRGSYYEMAAADGE
jgi:ATP-dependent DNA helicase RecG